MYEQEKRPWVLRGCCVNLIDHFRRAFKQNSELGEGGDGLIS